MKHGLLLDRMSHLCYIGIIKSSLLGILGSVHLEKILIIDDSPVQAAHLKKILEDDYHVTTVQEPEKGLEYAGQRDYSLILLDVVMPGMDGFELLKKLQEEVATRHIPVILITSLSDIENEQRGLTLGAVDYISKPFHPLIVKARVNTHINLYQYRKQVEFQSMTDQLTGIANRRGYDRLSEKRWQEAIRLKVPFSISMMDIDHFKKYNDTFGHPAGDMVISSVARAASTYLRRNTDFLARYGGEEFVAFMMGDDPEQAFGQMCKVRRAVEELHIPHSQSVSEWVTVSIGGITVMPKRGDSFDTYLRIADTMLYDAKRFGRNRVVWNSGNKKQLTE